MNKQKILILIISIIMVLCLAAFLEASTSDTVSIVNSSRVTEVSAVASIAPTQTPMVIYVVVTATPMPQEETLIERRQEDQGISLVNGSGTTTSTTGSEITLTNGDSSDSSQDLIEKIVATLTDQNSNVSGAAIDSNDTSDQCTTIQDGNSCTMSFELIGEPTYGSGAKVATGEVFWKEWEIRNTGTCTWTPDYYFVFKEGWQIGSTRFTMKRTVKPGETLNVRLGMTADLDPGKTYYSTYVLESPSGTQCGSLTSIFTVEGWKYFEPTVVPTRVVPKRGRPAYTDPYYCGYGCYPPRRR